MVVSKLERWNHARHLELGSRGFGGTASGGRVSIDDGMRALVTRGGAEHLTSLSFRPSRRGMEGFMEF